MSKEWLAIFESNFYVPPSAQRLKSTKPNDDSFPFAIDFKGVLLPASEAKNVTYQLRACFYDAANRRFFGRPWKSLWLKASESGQPKVILNETAYFHFPYKDNSIVLVVECVRDSPKLAEGGGEGVVGWAVLRLQPGVQRRDNIQAQVEMYQGSAEVLSLVPEPVESNSKLTKSGCVLQFSLRNHKVLARAYDYVPENTIIGSKEVVPGLEQALTGSAALENPVLKQPNPAVLDKLVVNLGPMADRIESEVCDLLNKERLFKENVIPNGETMMILEKRIRVGVHNGWTYLHEPYLFYLTSADTFDTRSLRHGAVKSHARRSSLDMGPGGGRPSQIPRGTLVLRNRIELNELVQDKALAVVFYLEYILGLQTSKPNPPAQVVTIAWGAWSPFETPPTGPLPVSLILRGGPSRNSDYVLCFRDYYSLSKEQQQIRNALEIVLKFNFILKHFLPPEETQPDRGHVSKPIPKDRQKPTPTITRPTSPPKDGDESLLPSSGGTTPAPPPREGRVPLVKVPKTPTTPGPQQPRGQIPTHYPFILPYPPLTPGQIWGAPGSIPAYPLAGPFGHMTEIPTVGTLHAPVLALQQNQIRTLTISRSVMAILTAASFEAIEDRHGDAPELVDIFDSTTFHLDTDLKDPLTCNEIIFQFMAFSHPEGFTAALPDQMFFTFHFYRFPQVNTEKLLLCLPEGTKTAAGSIPSIKIFRRLDLSGQTIAGSPGYKVKFAPDNYVFFSDVTSNLAVKFVVDPHYLKPGEHKLFLEYLYYHFLYIDVWDADSLMLVGSCLVPLRQLCRRSYEAVQAYCQLPVVTTELRSVASNESGDIQAVLKGLLYVKIACVGYPSAGGVNTLITDSAEMSRNSAIITHRLDKTTVGTDISVEKLFTRPQSLTLRYPNLRPMLVTGKKLEILETEVITEERRRKLNRVENLRQIERYTYAKFDRHSRREYAQDIQTIKQFRDQTKDKTILAALFHSISVVHTIFPTLGACEFMEFLLVNPYSEPCTLTVEISDPELKVVVDQQEWQFYKNLNNLLTPLETSMFVLKHSLDKVHEMQVQIFLKPREHVYIPFKYQTFHTIAFPNYDTKGDRFKASTTMNVLLQNKTVRTLFKNTRNNEMVSALVVQVEPQPHVIHQTFRFYQPERTFLSKFIRINLQDIRISTSRSIEAAYCTDPTVLCEIKEPSITSGFQDVYIKAPCGISPQTKTFSIMLYVDTYLSKPVQVWQIHIHALQKVDVTTVQGHAAKFSLVLKGGQANRVIRCFSSSPQELIVTPVEPFILQPGTVAEIQGQLKPMFTGERTLQITAVDVELRELVKSWLIYANVRHPNVTKGYQVTIPIGQSKTINKKLTFTNKYSVTRTFTVSSSREDLMVVKDPVLRLEPGATGAISLRFFTNVLPQVTEIMLFINDELENNEEAYGIKAVFVNP